MTGGPPWPPSYILKTLNKLNFGESLIQWISLFYKDAKSCITNNGHMSDFFTVSKGVRQGCPPVCLYLHHMYRDVIKENQF